MSADTRWPPLPRQLPPLPEGFTYEFDKGIAGRPLIRLLHRGEEAVQWAFPSPSELEQWRQEQQLPGALPFASYVDGDSPLTQLGPHATAAQGNHGRDGVEALHASILQTVQLTAILATVPQDARAKALRDWAYVTDRPAVLAMLKQAARHKLSGFGFKDGEPVRDDGATILHWWRQLQPERVDEAAAAVAVLDRLKAEASAMAARWNALLNATEFTEEQLIALDEQLFLELEAVDAEKH